MSALKTKTAKEAKNAFGLLIDEALVEPIAVSKHGRPVVVVMSFSQFESLQQAAASQSRRAKSNLVHSLQKQKGSST